MSELDKFGDRILLKEAKARIVDFFGDFDDFVPVFARDNDSVQTHHFLFFLKCTRSAANSRIVFVVCRGLCTITVKKSRHFMSNHESHALFCFQPQYRLSSFQSLKVRTQRYFLDRISMVHNCDQVSIWVFSPLSRVQNVSKQ